MNHKEGMKPCPFCGRTNQRLLTDMEIYQHPHCRGRRAIVCDCGLWLYAATQTEAEKMWQSGKTANYVTELEKQVDNLTQSRDYWKSKAEKLQIKLRKMEREQNHG